MFLINFWTLSTMLVLVILGNTNGKNNNFCTSSVSDNDMVDLIEDAKEASQTYQLPTNARQYEADDNNTTDYGTFDFIIIGAGSAGTVIANRLTEVPHWKVLLLEAGNFGNCLTNIPSLINILTFTEYTWGFVSTPQKNACLGRVENRCPLRRGKGIGGTTLINGLVYSRGSSIDFDRWAKHVNDSRWSYDKVLQYFKKSENFTYRDNTAPFYQPVHGKNGYLHVEHHLPRSLKLKAFIEANKDLGLPVADYNAYTGLGTSPAQFNTLDGSRQDGGTAFIHPVLNRANLVVLTNSYATKVLIHKENKTAYGVAFNYKNSKYTANVNEEVIVSAGTVNTPQLLMLSGIGPKSHLKQVDISVIQDLEVGSTLRDHSVFLDLNFGTNHTEPSKPLKILLEEFKGGYGPLTSAGNDAGLGFYESQFTKDTGYPDIEIIFVPTKYTDDQWKKVFSLKDSTYDDVWKNVNRAKTFIMYIVGLHTESTGTIRLKNNDPLDYPIIDNNLFSDAKNKDMDTIYEGIQLALKLSTTPALRKLDTKLQGGPLRACKHHKYRSKKYWYCAMRQMGMHFYHPVGTCPMGRFPEKGDVVDSELKVHGVKKLRVADGSVIPFTLAGHPNAPIVMIGEVLSDLLKKDYL